MAPTIPVAVETFSAAVAKAHSSEDREDITFSGYTRCGSGMGQSRDD